jgi:hypothetical protein
LFDSRGQFSDLVVDRTPLFHEFGDLLVGVHYRCVVATTEELANFW